MNHELASFMESVGGREMAAKIGVTWEEFVNMAELSAQINAMIQSGELTNVTCVVHYIDALPCSSALKVHIAFRIAHCNPASFE